MNTKFYLLFLTVLLISCNSQKLLTEANKDLKVLDLGTKQLYLMKKYQSRDTLVRNKILIDSIYSPNIELWNAYLGNERDFINWINKNGYSQLSNWNKKSQKINPRYLAEKLRETSVEMKKFTGFSAKGNWHIFYGPAWADLGSLGDGKMLIDLGHSVNNDAERIIWLYPHELNHQIQSNISKAKENIVLNRIIGEGFATYISYIFHKKKYSVAQELMYSEKEYEFCKQNEAELLSLLKNNYFKTDDDLSRKFANRSVKFKDSYPGAIGYYLGFRIVEEFVNKNGQNSWRKIYTMAPREVLEKSKILD